MCGAPQEQTPELMSDTSARSGGMRSDMCTYRRQQSLVQQVSLYGSHHICEYRLCQMIADHVIRGSAFPTFVVIPKVIGGPCGGTQVAPCQWHVDNVSAQCGSGPPCQVQRIRHQWPARRLSLLPSRMQSSWNALYVGPGHVNTWMRPQTCSRLWGKSHLKYVCGCRRPLTCNRK